MELTIEKVFKEILPGWKNLVFHDPAIEKMALERGEICRTCEFMNRGVIHAKYGRKCSVCGCPIAAKVRSPTSKCPKDKWK
jgi:hypothetical protein